MIVVDSSALLAILLNEPEKSAFETVIAGGERCIVSAVNAHETATVLRIRNGAAAVGRFWQFLADSEIEIVPFDEAQVRVAAAAFDVYGKGIHPKARLNLSDCAAYALAKTMSAPLLFKGDDFTHTDLQAAPSSAA
jgi:ribonuclease VapC